MRHFFFATSLLLASNVASAEGYLYFCKDSGLYYPYATTCASSWQKVLPQASPNVPDYSQTPATVASPVAPPAIEGGITPMPTSTTQRVGQATINAISARFKEAMESSGMSGVSSDVQACYDNALSKSNEIELIRACMLYDIAAKSFDKGFGTAWEARGYGNPGPVTSFFSEEAYKTRIEMYMEIAFKGFTHHQVGQYYGDAPSKVTDIITASPSDSTPAPTTTNSSPNSTPTSTDPAWVNQEKLMAESAAESGVRANKISLIPVDDSNVLFAWISPEGRAIVHKVCNSGNVAVCAQTAWIISATAAKNRLVDNCPGENCGDTVYKARGIEHRMCIDLFDDCANYPDPGPDESAFLKRAGFSDSAPDPSLPKSYTAKWFEQNNAEDSNSSAAAASAVANPTAPAPSTTATSSDSQLTKPDDSKEPNSASGEFGGFLAVIGIILVVGSIYFLPTLYAYSQERRQKGAICVLNLFLGWTVIGWVIALVWAAMEDRKEPSIPTLTDQKTN